MKTLSLANILKSIKFTVTRDGRMGTGKFNYYEDATGDAIVSNPTSHFMLNGSLSLPSVAYFGSEKSGNLELNNGHYAVYIGSTSEIGNNNTAVFLPEPSAAVLHRTYVIVNQKSSTIPVKFTTSVTTAVESFTMGATTITLSANNANIVIGCTVSGTGIAAGTTITNKVGLVLTLSAATTDESSETYTFTSTIPAITLSALPSTTDGITTVANLPINSVVVQCQRTSRALVNPQTYTWRIISATYAPAVGAAAGATTYHGGIFKVNLLRTTGVSISASTLSSYISITLNGASGIPVTGNSNQIIRQYTSGQNVSVSIASSLPSGYTFSYWRKTSPTPMTTASASQPFTQELANATTSGNTTITEIELVFSYSAPVSSQTYYGGGGGFGGGGGGGYNQS